jgi:hypothetical protein
MPELDDPFKHCCTAGHGVEVYLVDVMPAVVEVLDDLAMWVDDPGGSSRRSQLKGMVRARQRLVGTGEPTFRCHHHAVGTGEEHVGVRV